jgi:hypothetical protein
VVVIHYIASFERSPDIQGLVLREKIQEGSLAGPEHGAGDITIVVGGNIIGGL